MRNLAHFFDRTPHNTVRLSYYHPKVALPRLKYLRFRQQSGCDWPSSENHTMQKNREFDVKKALSESEDWVAKMPSPMTGDLHVKVPFHKSYKILFFQMFILIIELIIAIMTTKDIREVDLYWIEFGVVLTTLSANL